MKKSFFGFLSISFFILLIDQITKFYVIKNFPDDFAINRGISWSIFDSQSKYIFGSISIIIFIILLMFIYYTFLQFRKNKNIFAEILIISGGFSNLIDRLIHQGVVDFIDISCKNMHWPLFNFADIFIVFGLCIMLVKNIKE